MKLEFLDDITDNGKYPYADPDKLIRLYDFNQSETQQLIDIIQSRIITNNESLDLSTLDFIQTENCNLRFEIGSVDIGIKPSINNKFVCNLTVESYKTMVDYMKVFANKENSLGGYNWLYDPSENKIDLLFSPGGTW